MSVVVRAATAQDLAAVVALERAIGEAPHWAEAVYGEMLRQEDAGVRRCLLVAETEAGLAGFAVGSLARGGMEVEAELESVAVAAWARRRGVGRRLCEAVVEWSRREGAKAVDLEVRAGSGGATALYVGMGFVEVGRRRRYYSAPEEDAVLMRLNLGRVLRTGFACAGWAMVG